MKKIQPFKKLNMNFRFLLLTSSILITQIIYAQKTETYLISKAISGYPKEIDSTSNLNYHQVVNYYILETGIDSIQIMFVEIEDKKRIKSWECILNVRNSISSNEKISTSIDVIDTTIIVEEILFDNQFKKISLQFKYNSSTKEIQYIWLNNNAQSKTATIINIEKPLQKGKQFPPHKVVTLKGDTVSISDFMGKYLVINWWATSCMPCQMEIPGLNTLVEKYKSNSNIEFLAIAYDKKKWLKHFLKTKPFNYKQTIGGKVSDELFEHSFPKHIIVNPQGIITFYFVGGAKEIYRHIDSEIKRQLKIE